MNPLKENRVLERVGRVGWRVYDQIRKVVDESAQGK